MRNGPGAIEVGEPGAPEWALAQNAGTGSSLNDRGRQPALSSEIAPGRGVRPNCLSLGPAVGDGSVWILSPPCPIGRRKAWRQSGELAQALADMPEAKPWLQPLDETKDVTFSVAGWIPPTTPSMADDQDLALASPILQAKLRALLPVKLPARRCSLQHHGTMHLLAQFLDFGVVSAHIRSSRLGAGAWLSGLGLVFAPALPPDREAVALQGRAERAGACDEPLQRDRR